VASAVVMCGTFFGCGGGSDGGSNPMTSTPVAQRRLLTSGTFQLTDPATAFASTGGLLSSDFAVVPFNVGTAGTLDASVNWRFASNDIDIAIVQPSDLPNSLFESLVEPPQRQLLLVTPPR
jgi:hypothetical protein